MAEVDIFTFWWISRYFVFCSLTDSLKYWNEFSWFIYSVHRRKYVLQRRRSQLGDSGELIHIELNSTFSCILIWSYICKVFVSMLQPYLSPCFVVISCGTFEQSEKFVWDACSCYHSNSGRKSKTVFNNFRNSWRNRFLLKSWQLNCIGEINVRSACFHGPLEIARITYKRLCFL